MKKRIFILITICILIFLIFSCKSINKSETKLVPQYLINSFIIEKEIKSIEIDTIWNKNQSKSNIDSIIIIVK